MKAKLRPADDEEETECSLGSVDNSRESSLHDDESSATGKLVMFL